MSFGNLAFPKPLELSLRAWPGQGRLGTSTSQKPSQATGITEGVGLVGGGGETPHAHADTGLEVSDAPTAHVPHVKASWLDRY